MLEQILLYSWFWALVPGYTLIPLHWAWQECEYAEWEWAENWNGNFNSFRRWLISRLPNRPSGGSFNRRQSGSALQVFLFYSTNMRSAAKWINTIILWFYVLWRRPNSALFFCCETSSFFFFLLNCFHPQPRVRLSSAPLVFQDVESFLVLRLERHDKVVRGDLPLAVLVHLAHEDVVQAWWGHTKKTWMQWRNGRDIQGGQISESPHGRSVYHMFMRVQHINM